MIQRIKYHASACIFITRNGDDRTQHSLQFLPDKVELQLLLCLVQRRQLAFSDHNVWLSLICKRELCKSGKVSQHNEQLFLCSPTQTSDKIDLEIDMAITSMNPGVGKFKFGLEIMASPVPISPSTIVSKS